MRLVTGGRASREVNTGGLQNVHLESTWGQSTAAGNIDPGSLVVEWRLRGGTWSTVQVHELALNLTTGPAANTVDALLPGAEGGLIEVRFTGNTTLGTHEARVDNVVVSGDPPAEPVPPPAVVREVTRLRGWNLVAWTGPDGTVVAEAAADLGTALIAMFTWEAQAQAFLRYGPGDLAILNTLRTLNDGDGVWVRVSRTVIWPQPLP